jgi:hypothetical protein
VGVEVAVGAGVGDWLADGEDRAVGIAEVAGAAPGKMGTMRGAAEAGALAGAVEAAAPDLPDGVARGAADGPGGADPGGFGAGGVNP